MVKTVKSRKVSLLSAWVLTTVLLGVLAVSLFNEIYIIRLPWERRAILSPVSDKPQPKKTSLLQVEVAHAEAPVPVPQNNTGQELSSLQAQVLAYFPKEEHEAVIELVHRESTWNPHAVNPSSGATGLFQALPWSKTGCDSTDNIKCQASWGSEYIKARYGTAQNAISFHDKNGWY